MGIQRPPQTCVWVQNDPLGQSFAPRKHGCVGNTGGIVLGRMTVLMQRPPQGPEVGQAVVGVQMAPEEHPGVPPIVQGGSGVCDARQRPPQV